MPFRLGRRKGEYAVTRSDARKRLLFRTGREATAAVRSATENGSAPASVPRRALAGTQCDPLRRPHEGGARGGHRDQMDEFI